jgi:NADH-quinone oxidoreductase subunit N
MADLERGRHTAILMGHQVSRLFWVVAAASMTVGNLLGLLQDNLKRLLAYSGVAHAGYMLIGLAAAPYLRTSEPDVVGGVAALLFYLVGYGAMTVGAFAVIAYLSTPERPVETVDDLAGLVRSHPAVALLMALFLFSLIGIPATAGFAGKLLLFLGAMAVPSDQGDASLLDAASLFRLLALVAVVNAAIGAWYYLRILSAIFLRNPLKPLQARKGWPATVGLATCGLLTLGLGVYPWPLLRNVQTAVAPPPAPAGAERALR